MTAGFECQEQLTLYSLSSKSIQLMEKMDKGCYKAPSSFIKVICIVKIRNLLFGYTYKLASAQMK